MRGRIEVVKSRAKKLYSPAGMVCQLQWHVRWIGGNNRVLMASETYKRESGALALVDKLVKGRIPTAVKVVDETGD